MAEVPLNVCLPVYVLLAVESTRLALYASTSVPIISPKLSLASEALVAPVPPFVIGRTKPPGRAVIVSVISVPSLNTNVDPPAGIATPVPVIFLIVTVSVKVLLTKYNFSILGTIKSCGALIVPTKLSLRLRAV